MADEQTGRIVDSLDPRHYVEHVTRTALLLERLAGDVKELRLITESSVRGTDALRTEVSRQDREAAVYRERTTSDISINREAIKEVEERLRWLSRLVIAAVLTGLISGALALVWQSIGS